MTDLRRKIARFRQRRRKERGIKRTHHKRRLPQLGRDLRRNLPDQPLPVIDHKRETRRPALLNLLRAELDDEMEVEELP